MNVWYENLPAFIYFHTKWCDNDTSCINTYLLVQQRMLLSLFSCTLKSFIRQNTYLNYCMILMHLAVIADYAYNNSSPLVICTQQNVQDITLCGPPCIFYVSWGHLYSHNLLWYCNCSPCLKLAWLLKFITQVVVLSSGLQVLFTFAMNRRIYRCFHTALCWCCLCMNHAVSLLMQ